jgi:Bacterial Ig domain
MARCVAGAALASLALWIAAAPTIAQPLKCEISPIRGASSPQGAVATMRVINDGRSCGLTNYGLPAERQNPATDGVITQPPTHGKAEFVGPRVQYTPKAGYVGEDAFAYEARTADATGRPIVLKVHLKVKVRPGR